MDLTQELGVQSFCFRGFKRNEEVIEKLKECGLSKIELCGVHADFQDHSLFQSVADLYKENGIDIVSIGVQPFGNDAEKEEPFFRCAQTAGCKFISADFALKTIPDSFRTAERLAEEYDVRLAIHNHGGGHWLGTSEMLDFVFQQTSDRIGLSLDTAWAIDARQDPVKMVQRFADRLYGLHIKDFTYQPDRSPEDVVVGTGLLDLEGLLAAMKSVSFEGYTVLEYEGDVDNPVPAIKQCVEAVQKTWSN